MSPSLQQTLSQDKLLELIKDDPEVMKTLIPHLPEGQQTNENLEANLRSSQLQQAMRTLTQAIQSDQADIILASCGLDAKFLKDSKDPMEGLMKALIDKHSSKKEGGDGDKKDDEKKDGDKKDDAEMKDQ